MTTFLGSPDEIQREIGKLVQGSRTMKAAVAFIGQGYWRRLFDGYPGQLQVICWLKSPGTNPYAVEEMMKHPRIKVRQVDSMHAKVYLAPGAAAIVGSANLSGVALGDRETAGRHEAAVLVEEPGVVKEIAEWFDRLWGKARVDITDVDIRAAKVAYDARPKDGLKSGPTTLAEDSLPAAAVGETVLSPILAPQPEFTPIIGMPNNALGKPLYSDEESAVARFFMLFTGSGNTKSDITRQRTSKDTERMVLDKHSDEDGVGGRRWDIAVDGKIMPFVPGWFEALPGQARVQFVNERRSPHFVNWKHPRGQKYPTDLAIAEHRAKTSARKRSRP